MGCKMTPSEVKQIRQQLGLSQAGLAALIGGGDNMTVSRWERGERTPGHQAATLLRLLAWLHVEYPHVYAAFTMHKPA